MVGGCGGCDMVAGGTRLRKRDIEETETETERGGRIKKKKKMIKKEYSSEVLKK